MKILVRGFNSSKNLPLQPIAAHSYVVILVRGYFLKSSPIAALLLHHFTPSEQKTLTLYHQFTPIDNLPSPHFYNKMGGF